MRTPKSFLIGATVDGQVALEQFATVTTRLHYDFLQIGNYGQAIETLSQRPSAEDGDFDDLVLFCVGQELMEIEAWLSKIRSAGRKVILFTHEARASTDAAIHYCHQGLAHDCIVMSSSAPSVIQEHVTRIHRRKEIYGSFDVKIKAPGKGECPAVFVSTPFLFEHRLAMSDMVQPAMDKLGLKVYWADCYERDKSLHNLIREQISASALLIANISQSPTAASLHNPNVYYEAGQAAGQGKPVIFVRPLAEKDSLVPADIVEKLRVEYGHPIELALRLYHGLRPCVPLCQQNGNP